MIDDILEIFENNKLFLARMIGHSKSMYRTMVPDGNPVFNANIFTLEDGKIWHGDLDLKYDAEALQNTAKELGKTLYVLREMDGRFDNENPDEEHIKSKAVETIVVCEKSVYDPSLLEGQACGLLPCPFCGNHQVGIFKYTKPEDDNLFVWMAFCGNGVCSARTLGNDKTVAIDRWQARPDKQSECITSQPPKPLENVNGITVAQLKEYIASWPEVDLNGDPTEVWLETGKNLSSVARFVVPLNVRTTKEGFTADIILEPSEEVYH